MPRYAKRVDSNQKYIVGQLRAMGISVELDHDDILVGFRGRTYWFEIKNPERAVKKDGELGKNEKRESQRKLEQGWQGHYRVVTTVDEILEDLGI